MKIDTRTLIITAYFIINNAANLSIFEGSKKGRVDEEKKHQ